MAWTEDLDREAVQESANELLIILRIYTFLNQLGSHDSYDIDAINILKTYISLNRLDPMIATILGYQIL